MSHLFNRSSKMSIKEYLVIKKEQEAIIERAEALIYTAREKADKEKFPKKKRPATAEDIKIGSVIWHYQKREYGGSFWIIVEEPLHYGDTCKEYIADDGCRYGLDEAYIDLS